MKKGPNLTELLMLTIIIIIILLAIWLYYKPCEKVTLLYPFNLATEGYIATEVSIDASTLYMFTECYQLSMDIIDTQALSISRGLEKKIDKRPLTHDILNDILDNFGIEVLAVKVVSFEDGVFYSDIILRKGNEILSIDSRPSDAVAVAVRSGAPVYVKEELLKLYGEDRCRSKEKW